MSIIHSYPHSEGFTSNVVPRIAISPTWCVDFVKAHMSYSLILTSALVVESALSLACATHIIVSAQERRPQNGETTGALIRKLKKFSALFAKRLRRL